MKTTRRNLEANAALLFLFLLSVPLGIIILTACILVSLSSLRTTLPSSASYANFREGGLRILPPAFFSVNMVLALPPPLSEALLISDVTTNEIYYVLSDAPAFATPLVQNAGGAASDVTANTLRRPGVAGMAVYDAVQNHLRVVVARHATRDIALLTLSPPPPGNRLLPSVVSIVPVASMFNGSRLNSPHSVCVDDGGNVFFSDPTFGLIAASDEFDRALDAPSAMEQASQNVFYIPAKSIAKAAAAGSQVAPILLIEDLDRPTGLAVVDDKLFVATASPRRPLLAEYGLVRGADGVTHATKGRRILYEWSGHLHRWGQLGFSGVTAHLCAIGKKWLFVGAGNGLAIFDIANAEEVDETLTPINWIPIGKPPGPPSLTAGSKGRLYVAAGERVIELQTYLFTGSKK